MNIGYNLRKFRAKSKKSQQEIADLLEVDRRTYINWENEKNDLKSEYIPKLAKIFNIDINDLFQERGTKINKVNITDTINGVVFVLTDEESINRLAEVLKINIRN